MLRTINKNFFDNDVKVWKDNLKILHFLDITEVHELLGMNMC